MKNQIICSAIKMPDGYIVRGHRHNDCFHTIAGIPKYKEARKEERLEQGFMTSENKFVDRKEAIIIAVNGGQLNINMDNLIEQNLRLYSENLW